MAGSSAVVVGDVLVVGEGLLFPCFFEERGFLSGMSGFSRAEEEDRLMPVDRTSSKSAGVSRFFGIGGIVSRKRVRIKFILRRGVSRSLQGFQYEV